MTDEPPAPVTLDRRHLLASALLGIGAGAVPASSAAAANGATPNPTLPPMTAQATEGPYYLPLNLVRADITEGLSGIPVDIRFTVLDERGEPFVGAAVDVWHCNAQGSYSGFDQPGAPAANTAGGTFLRGTQPVGSDGAVLFHSIYPGWYRGRTTHIHFKVRHGGRTNLTSQFFLPDTLSEYLYSQVPAYARRELRDTLNRDDGIAIEAGDTVEGSVRETAGRYLATLTVRVDRAATSPAEGPGRFGPPPGPFGPPPGPPGPGPARTTGRPPRHPDDGSGPPPRPEQLTGDQRVAALLPTAARVARAIARVDRHPSTTGYDTPTGITSGRE